MFGPTQFSFGTIITLFPPKIEDGPFGDNPGQVKKQHEMFIKISIESTAALDWTLSVDREAYSLVIMTRVSPGKPRDEMQVVIKAPTYYGAGYALETLSQLVTYRSGLFYVPSSVRISDKPVYPYRGVLVDTSRNYYSIDSLKKIVDGMGYNKLNVLHWHLTDAAAFPFVSQRVPNMTAYGAYSERYVMITLNPNQSLVNGPSRYLEQRTVFLNK